MNKQGGWSISQVATGDNWSVNTNIGEQMKQGLNVKLVCLCIMIWGNKLLGVLNREIHSLFFIKP